MGAGGAPGGRERAIGLAQRVRALTWTDLWSAAFLVTLVLVRFKPPRAEWSINLDHSWRQVYPYFHARGLQAGVDYVFTYGPLAHLEVGTFLAEQFWTRVLVWQLGFGSLVALLLVGLARRIPTALERGLFTLLVLLAAPAAQAWWSLVMAGVCVWLLDDARRSRVRLALGFAVLALVSLLKFPYLLLAGLSAIALASVWTGARGKLAGPAVLAGFVASIALAWLVAGQRLSALPAYLATSLELARGYAQAMYRPAPVLALSLALVALLVSGAWFVSWGWARPISTIRRLAAGVLLIATLLAYKSSFVLYDNDGAFFYFVGAAALLPLTLRDHAPSRGSPWRLRTGGTLRGLGIACALLGAPSVLRGADPWPRRELLEIGLRGADSLRCLSDPGAFEREQERVAAENATLHALPRCAEIVGEQPIDFFGINQAILVQAGFHYSPRPVFQSYAAFTPALMELNRSFYESERAPPFVAISLQPGHGHWPTMEDGLALQSLVRDYEPVLSERGVMLWQLRARAERPPVARTVVLDRTVTVGEWLELGELEPGCRVARIEIEPTLLGRLRELVYQPAPLFVELRTGESQIWRFLLGHLLAKGGMILDPLILNQRDLARWAAGLGMARPRAIRLVADGPFYAREARVVVERAPDVWPKPTPDAARRFAYPGFATVPDRERLPLDILTGWLRGRDVLFVGAPSELAFDLAPGRWRLGGTYGCLPARGKRPSCGVDFRIVLGERATLLERTLEPRLVAADREPQDLEVVIQCEAPTTLLLQTLPRATDVPPDAAYWSELRIEPASEADGSGG